MGAHELCPTEVGFLRRDGSYLGLGQIEPSRLATREYASAYGAIREVRVRKVGLFEIGAEELEPTTLYARQLRPRERCPLSLGALETRLFELGVLEEGTLQGRS